MSNLPLPLAVFGKLSNIYCNRHCRRIETWIYIEILCQQFDSKCWKKVSDEKAFMLAFYRHVELSNYMYKCDGSVHHPCNTNGIREQTQFSPLFIRLWRGPKSSCRSIYTLHPNIVQLISLSFFLSIKVDLGGLVCALDAIIPLEEKRRGKVFLLL